MDLFIKEIIGLRCITKEDGQKIYDIIHKQLIQDEAVTLDFEDITQFAAPFFNFAIGQLLKDVKETNLKQLIHYRNLNDVGRMIIERVIINSIQYYKNENYHKIVDDIFKQQSSEED